MTTEHVSVPRELIDELKHLERLLYSIGLDHWMKNVKTILSRATPSDEHDPCTDECSENPKIRQAYANGYDVGYAHGKARPSAPRVVTAELSNTLAGDIAEHLRDKGWSSGGDYQDDFLPDVEIATRAALDSFANSMSAARVPDGLSAWVSDMKTSAGMDYYVCVGFRDRSKYLTPNLYKIRGRAEFDVAEWNHLLGLGPKPDLLAFDTEAAAPQAGKME